MMTALKKLENHFELSMDVSTLNALDKSDAEKLIDSCKDLPFLLISINNPDQYLSINVEVLNHLNDLIVEFNGALVVVLDKEDTKEIDWNINIVPSYDEGVDFIYMEKLEKELLDGFGE
ncbi:hypothetical protein GYB22_05285 [bacterium]|nr:hypothetical protein [bacterium]